MKQLLLFLCATALVATGCSTAEKYARNNNAGEVWLAQNRGLARMDVNGAWMADDPGWGSIRFIQDGNTFTGVMGNYSVRGVIRGSGACLLLSSDGWIYYTAIVTKSGNTLHGFYSSSVPFSSAGQYPLTLRRIGN